MNTKEKLLQYIEYKEITQGKFCKRIGVSNGFLTSGKHVGSEKLKAIRDTNEDLNMNWLIYDEGEMILEKQILDEHELMYDRLLVDGNQLPEELASILKGSNLYGTIEFLIKEYLSLDKKYLSTLSSLHDLTITIDEIKEMIKKNKK